MLHQNEGWISQNIKSFGVSPLFPFFRATLNWISYKFAQCGLVDCLISNMHLMESQICKKCTVYISYSMPIAQYTCCKITYQNIFFSKRRTTLHCDASRYPYPNSHTWAHCCYLMEYSPNLSHSMHHHHQLFHDIENVFAALTYWRLRLKISCIECTCALRKVALIRVGKSGEDTGLDISPRLCSFRW